MSVNSGKAIGLTDVPSPVFLVDENYKQILHEIYTGLQQTKLWQMLCGSCFCAAGFVNLTFNNLGHRSHVIPCSAIALKDGAAFILGNKDSKVASGKVDGHVVCLVDEAIIVDFGLKNIQRNDDFKDFPNAIACEIDNDKLFPREILLDDERRIIWSNGWVNPRTDEVMAENRPVYEQIYEEYIALPSLSATTSLRNLE